MSESVVVLDLGKVSDEVVRMAKEKMGPLQRMSAAEYRNLSAGKQGGGRAKYGNRKVLVDGMLFDSRREGKRWLELKFLQQAGEISDLERQVKFTLVPPQKIDGKVVERAITYVADFAYCDKHGNIVVEDAKGFRTPEYVIKHKLMLWILGIRVIEV